MPELIHYNQNAYVKGKSIFDAVRTIDDILEFTKCKKMSGILVAIDFEKAFDSLDHSYLLKVLHTFNFGPSFIQWIRTFYSNISSCIINNGFTTDYFAVGRGVRQGDPLSPLLFILGLEILACSRARKIFEFHLAHWASNSHILLARGPSPLAQVFKLINNS